MTKRKSNKKPNAFKQAILDDKNIPELTIGEKLYKGVDPMYQMIGDQMVKVKKGTPYVRVIEDQS